MNSSFVTYEQPLNENIRLCLRLEHLFKQLNYYLESITTQNCRSALETLLKIADVSDRPELKTKLVQALNQQYTNLSQLASAPEIDKSKLHQILQQLNILINGSRRNQMMKIGEPLRNDPLLKQIRLQFNNPAGACDFNIPAYTLWLHLPEEKRCQDLQKWKNEFNLLENTIETILSLTRNSASKQKVITSNVFYQQPLDPQNICQMIRITLPTSLNIYPEISVGKHRIAIRFKPLNEDTKGTEAWKKLQEELSFQISCCTI